MLKCLYILIFLFSLSYQYDYCNGRIYIDNNALSLKEISSLCDNILKDDRYVILITTVSTYTTSASFSEKSEKFYNEHCNITKRKCEDNMAICIFLSSKEGEKGTIRIISGANIKNKIDNNDRQDIINRMVPLLRQNLYYDAIINAIKEISAYFHSSVLLKIFIFFIILLVVIGVIYYFLYYRKQQRHMMLIDANTSKEILLNQISDCSSNRLNDSYFPDEESINNNCNLIHNHICFLLNIISMIRKSSPPILSIEKCLLCMRMITGRPIQYIEMNNLTTLGQTPEDQYVENGNTRFGCMHVYHSECLRKFNIGQCLMCKVKNDEVINNNYNSEVVDENQIKSLIVNFPKLYTIKDLTDYVNNYNSEFNMLNMETYGNQLYAMWFNENRIN